MSSPGFLYIIKQAMRERTVKQMEDRVKLNKPQAIKILNTARALFYEKGYDRTSLRDIANACRFEGPNMYNYYRSKEHLLFEVLREETASIVAELRHLENHKTLSPTERLEKLIRINVEINVCQPRISGELFDSGLKNLSPTHRANIVELRDEYGRILCKIIQDGVNAGDFGGVDVKVAYYAIASMIVRCRMWFSPGGRLSAGEVADNMARLVLNGLKGGVEKGESAKPV